MENLMTQKIICARRASLRTVMGAWVWALVTAGCLVMASPANAEERPKLAVMDTVLIDYQVTDTGSPLSTPEDEERVRSVVSDVLRKRMAELGTYQVLPRTSGDAQVQQPVDLSCAYCVYDWAKAEGADFVLTSAVMRVSNIILYLKLGLDNVATAKAVKMGDVQIKGFGEKELRGGALYAVDKVFGAAQTEDKGASPEGPSNGR